MAIQNINLGTAPNGVGGDTLRSTATKINGNFSDQTNAASKLVGKDKGQVPLVEAIAGLTYSTKGMSVGEADIDNFKAGQVNFVVLNQIPNQLSRPPFGVYAKIVTYALNETGIYLGQIAYDISSTDSYIRNSQSSGNWGTWKRNYTSENTTKDSNGFLKGASPIVKVHADKVVLNEEAEQQNVTFIKNGIGDYTINTVSGLSTDGWYLELPKDLNGNPKVAVTLSEVEGVITLKSYKRIFSMETFNFIPDLDTPLDIPTDRWIDIRLNEIPKEYPIIPSEPVAPYSEV